MEAGPLLKGLAIGLSIAAPVGPIGTLCIQRTLAGGRLHGFISGLGSAVADALFGSVAAFSLTFISSIFLDCQDWLRSLGGLFLLYLGGRIFRSVPTADEAPQPRAMGHAGAFASTFFLTVTNPITILFFAAIFGGLGSVEATTRGGYGSASLLVFGVFSGSALWWLILSTTTEALGKRLNPTKLLWVNRISGVIVVAFGLGALVSLFL